MNGGIGTYIKSKEQSHDSVKDSVNNACRVDMDVQAKVIGEGGNLGVTKLARTKFGLAGGLMNTDYIDNSGGVDCSDFEVNIKQVCNWSQPIRRLIMQSVLRC